MCFEGVRVSGASVHVCLLRVQPRSWHMSGKSFLSLSHTTSPRGFLLSSTPGGENRTHGPTHSRQTLYHGPTCLAQIFFKQLLLMSDSILSSSLSTKLPLFPSSVACQSCQGASAVSSLLSSSKFLPLLVPEKGPGMT